MAVDHARRAELQAQIAASATTTLAAGKSVVISAPTGFGKTNVALDILRRLTERRPDLKTLVVQDRQAVGEQNIARARSMGLTDATLSIDGQIDTSGKLSFGIANTLHANLDKIGRPDLVWIDECHHASADDQSRHSEILDAVLRANPNAVILGTSATLERSDKAQLHSTLDQAARFHITYEEAIGCGAIVPPKVICPPYRLLDGSTVSETVDQFLDPADPSIPATGIQKALSQGRPDNYFEMAIRAWKKANDGKVVPTFAYASTIKDAETLRDAFTDAGVRVAVIHSRLSKAAQNEAFEAYRSGRVDVLSSVDMLCEGVDITKTQSLLCLKETTSRSEWIQINGRGARAHTEAGFDKAFYTVVDMGASTYMHGQMDRYRAIENFVVNGPVAETNYRPWRRVAEDPATKMVIYGLHDGKRTLFAVRPKAGARYLLLEKKEICVGRRKMTTKRIVPFAKRSVTSSDIVSLGREIARQRFDVMTTLESRPVTSNYRSIVQRSFDDSKDALLAYAGARTIPEPRQSLTR